MRTFVFVLLASVAYAAPQGGYNYQIQFDSSIRNDLSQEQYQLLQQYAQQQISQEQQVQQQQPQQPEVHQILEAASLPTTSQTVTQGSDHGAGGYHFETQRQPQPEVHAEPIVQKVEPAALDNVQPPIEPSRQEEQQSLPISQPRYQSAPQPHERHHPVQYNKEFYYLSAPQEDFEQSHDLDNHLDNLKKNIRVVFIRAPEQNGLANAALQLAKQSMDQQTVVYVLTKQHDSAELVNKLQQVRNSAHSKPDVIFVKYKTPEEAEHAQRTIQSQYEALDGPNHFNHQDVVSTHNFVGSTDRHHGNRAHIDPRKSSTKAEAEAPSSKYLPAAAKH